VISSVIVCSRVRAFSSIQKQSHEWREFESFERDLEYMFHTFLILAVLLFVRACVLLALYKNKVTNGESLRAFERDLEYMFHTFLILNMHRLE
jgi:hypothetical protein